MAEACCESLEVMRDMTCTMDHLAMAVENSNLYLRASESSSGEMKPDNSDDEEIKFVEGEEGSKESSEETSEEGSGSDEELLDVGLSQLKKRKLR